MAAHRKAWALAASGAALAAVAGGCASGQAQPAAQPQTATVTAPAPTATVTQAPAQTGTAPPPQAAPAPPVAAAGPDPATVVREFYADLNSGDYPDAWALGGDNIAGTDYATWAAGYASTVAVSGQATDAGGGVVDVTFSADQSDGSVSTYSGTYTVSGGVIVSADVAKTG